MTTVDFTWIKCSLSNDAWCLDISSHCLAKHLKTMLVRPYFINDLPIKKIQNPFSIILGSFSRMSCPNRLKVLDVDKWCAINNNISNLAGALTAGSHVYCYYYFYDYECDDRNKWFIFCLTHVYMKWILGSKHVRLLHSEGLYKYIF